ncbi:hypothetical protein AKJ16_DCAP01487 [Drosera capensis]
MALSRLVMISALVLFATVLATADIPVSGGGSTTKPAVGTPSGNFTKPAVGAVTPPIGLLSALRSSVYVKVQPVKEAEPVPEIMRSLLLSLQVRAAGHLWQLRYLSLLRQPHHPRWPPQVPMITSTE